MCAKIFLASCYAVLNTKLKVLLCFELKQNIDRTGYFLKGNFHSLQKLLEKFRPTEFMILMLYFYNKIFVLKHP